MQRPFLERFLPKACLQYVFRTSVEQELLRKPKRPPHEFDLALAIFVEENNRLDRIGSDVLPRLEIDLFKTGAHHKGVCDALLIGAATIASGIPTGVTWKPFGLK
jgi:hypothetical protein